MPAPSTSWNSLAKPAPADEWVCASTPVIINRPPHAHRHLQQYVHAIGYLSGLGSGGTVSTNVGGPASSFGIWHEDTKAVQEMAAKYSLTIERIHTHIGSGTACALCV